MNRGRRFSNIGSNPKAALRFRNRDNSLTLRVSSRGSTPRLSSRKDKSKIMRPGDHNTLSFRGKPKKPEMKIAR